MARYKYAIIILLLCAACFVYLGDWEHLSSDNRSFNGYPQIISKLLQSDGDNSIERKGDEVKEAIGNEVLVMSSVGRSGSSFLGELLSQQPLTFYIFEPNLYLQMKTPEGVTASTSRRLLQNLYSCQFPLEWLQWAKGRRSTLSQQRTRQIYKENDLTKFKDGITHLCSESGQTIIKVIKMRVSWVAELLQHTDSSLKVIHLVRDPRGSFHSLQKQKMLQRDYDVWCPKIQEDLELVTAMRILFPNSFFHIKYEDLCYHPFEMAGRLWRFLNGSADATLPDSWNKFLQLHTSASDGKSGPSKINPFGTSRDSRKEAEAWRLEISNQTLLGVEKACGEVLDLLKYNKFGSLIHARNLSLPLMQMDTETTENKRK